MKRVLCCLLLLSAALTSQAQTQSEATPIKIGSLDFSGNIRERYEIIDFFDPGKGQNFYGFSGTQIRFGISQTREKYDWKLEFAVPILLGLPDGASLPPPLGQLGLGGTYYSANNRRQNAAFFFPKQVFFRPKWGHSSARFGRFEFADGGEVKPKDATLANLKSQRINQHLIGMYGFSDVMRSFDGAEYQHNKGQWNFTAMSAVPTRGVFQVDGWGWVKTPVTYVAVTKEVDAKEAHAEWRVFGIYYNDDRGVLKTDNRPLSLRAKDLQAINIGTVGGHFIAAFNTESGTFDVLGWGALQTGDWGKLKQRSGAGAFEAGWQPNFWESVKPWFRAGMFYSSGDGNSGDGTHGTYFAILSTPRIYARFPFYNTMDNRDFFGEVILRPSKSLTLRSDVHGLWLTSGNDLWYTGGGAYQPWTFGFQGRPSLKGGTKLANLYDISGDFKWQNGLSLGLYFCYAQGGSVVKPLFPVNSNAVLSFTEFNYRF